MNKLSDYDFHLPKELIATTPLLERGSSRLCVLKKNQEQAYDDVFSNISYYLNPGDVVVINNTKVMKARIFAFKESGSSVEILLVRPTPAGSWTALLSGKGNLIGKTLFLGNDTHIEVLQKFPHEPGLYEIKSDCDLSDYAKQFGEIPLPPYFGRKANEHDNTSYQTIFAKDENLGAVAAPTAGLHFTPQLIDELKKKSINIVETTLHVGPGTFLPVRCENIDDHKMHSEFFILNQNAADALNNARKQGKRIIVVGTTAMRVIEQSMQWAHERGVNYFSGCEGQTKIFIRPGYRFLGCDAIITNFHTPKSTLLMLVSAVIGRKLALRIYAEAVEKKYRFFSYGDACYFEIRNDVNE
ncbi:MAG: tRNA preQ1(34) S-adenosylmethionine ribosyltransferase-isomerase QueA [Myxococcales bacterium]|nr:tRNA preQ1(34) S-adenosylmethionine ribosyltransferase-isomerase QueA [Myxococcales bacterium]USN51063.1 MAG: tRNA preQ1(34) S-adenosylmethionine ribosyltransferase-isomerase QueA [Myxococcales bacterium]